MNKKGYIVAYLPAGRIFETLEEVRAWAHPHRVVAAEVTIVEPPPTAADKLEGFTLE